jgi:hypothetical protein
MSDTPETNAAEERCIATGFKTGYVDVEFALQLERERDKARDMVFRLRRQRAIARKFGEQMERERDDLRADQINHENLSMRYMDERDKALESLAFIAEWGGKIHETECGDIRCDGDWCAEQARSAIYLLKENQ